MGPWSGVNELGKREFIMKKLVIIFALYFLSFSVQAEIRIVSDLDDTIKITNVGNWSQTVRNALFSKKAFAGMPELIYQMQSYTVSFSIITASPKLLNSKIESFLSYHDLETQYLFTRDIINESDKLDYKVKAIEKILSENEGELILMGDDTQKDVDVFQVIKNRYPERILAVYIHSIKNKDLPEGFHKFYTAMEIARHEVRAKRMNLTEAYAVMNAIQIAPRNSLVLPEFAHCPKKIEEYGEIVLSHMAHSLEQTYYPLINYCYNR